MVSGSINQSCVSFAQSKRFGLRASPRLDRRRTLLAQQHRFAGKATCRPRGSVARRARNAAQWECLSRGFGIGDLWREFRGRRMNSLEIHSLRLCSPDTRRRSIVSFEHALLFSFGVMLSAGSLASPRKAESQISGSADTPAKRRIELLWALAKLQVLESPGAQEITRERGKFAPGCDGPASSTVCDRASYSSRRRAGRKPRSPRRFSIFMRGLSDFVFFG